MSKIVLLMQSPGAITTVSLVVCRQISHSCAVQRRILEGEKCWWKQTNKPIKKRSLSSYACLWQQNRSVSWTVCRSICNVLTINGSGFLSHWHRTVKPGFLLAENGVHNTAKSFWSHQPCVCHLTRSKQGSESVRNNSPDDTNTIECKDNFTACTIYTLAEKVCVLRAQNTNTSSVVKESKTNSLHKGTMFGLWGCSNSQSNSRGWIRKPALTPSWSIEQRLHMISQHVSKQTAGQSLTPARPALLRNLETSGFSHPPASPTVPLRCLHTMDQFTLDNASYRQYLESLVQEQQGLAAARLKGETVEHSRLMFVESVAATVKELQSARADVGDLQSILSGGEDRELQSLARTDVENVQRLMEQLQRKLVELLVGPEPGDKNDIMLEVSAGVGGQEAMLFTAEMLDMYASYANFKGWTFSVVEREKSDIGGLRRASALITGEDVYKHLKFEAGVHRVQRIPKTEKSGRIHTSTMTVAVLPQPSQIDISVNPKDLHIDTFRSGGAGGQHVNKTESAVRITHKPSGTVAECQQERSQIKNRELAMKILLSRLYRKQVEEQETALRRKRKLQVGSAGRSEKIRTYNYSQDRVTDHRGPVTVFGVSTFLGGEVVLEDLIQGLMLQTRLEILAALVDEFVESKQLGQ